jgi:hypothetical protein
MMYPILCNIIMHNLCQLDVSDTNCINMLYDQTKLGNLKEYNNNNNNNNNDKIRG